MKLLPVISLTLLVCLPQAGMASKVCEARISAGDALRFDVSEIQVPPDCRQFTVHLEHTGMLPKAATGHNWVLTASKDMDSVARDAVKAGSDNGWIPPDDPRIIASIPLIGRGERGQVTFEVNALEPGTRYGFLCTVAGHSPRMRGSVRLVNQAADPSMPQPGR